MRSCYSLLLFLSFLAWPTRIHGSQPEVEPALSNPFAPMCSISIERRQVAPRSFGNATHSTNKTNRTNKTYRSYETHMPYFRRALDCLLVGENVAAT